MDYHLLNTRVHLRPPFKISNMLKICILGLSPSAMAIKAGEEKIHPCMSESKKDIHGQNSVQLRQTIVPSLQ